MTPRLINYFMDPYLEPFTAIPRYSLWHTSIPYIATSYTQSYGCFYEVNAPANQTKGTLLYNSPSSDTLGMLYRGQSPIESCDIANV